jgi:2-phospho-L-lactate guanylyltransferase (CobY/MobA/RfbA family)
MLGDVLTACVATAPTRVVTSDPAAAELSAELGASVVGDPGDGQSAAVAAGLAGLAEEPTLVVNADVPCVVPHDLRTLASAAELGAFGLVQAEDGTTNALALPTPAASLLSTAPGARGASGSTPRHSGSRRARP